MTLRVFSQEKDIEERMRMTFEFWIIFTLLRWEGSWWLLLVCNHQILGTTGWKTLMYSHSLNSQQSKVTRNSRRKCGSCSAPTRRKRKPNPDTEIIPTWNLSSSSPSSSHCPRVYWLSCCRLSIERLQTMKYDLRIWSIGPWNTTYYSWWISKQLCSTDFLASQASPDREERNGT